MVVLSRNTDYDEPEIPVPKHARRSCISRKILINLFKDLLDDLLINWTSKYVVVWMKEEVPYMKNRV